MGNPTKFIGLGYRVITGFIIYLGSYFFALNVFSTLLGSVSAVYPFIIAGLTGSLINYLLYHFFSDRYHYWYLMKDGGPRGYISGAVLLPPVATFFMSVALTLFIASIFSSEYKEVWSQSLTSLPEVVNYIAKEIVVLRILLIVVVFIIPIGFLVWGFKRWGESLKVKLILYPSVIIGTLLFIYIFGNYLKENQEVGSMILEYIRQGIYVLLGFIPLHWFYELFVAPFKKRVEVPKLSDVVQTLEIPER